MIKIVLAGPPMAKQRVRVRRDGHAYTPERTVAYEGRLALAMQEVMGERPPLEGALIVNISVYVPIPKSKPVKWKEAALAGKIRPTVKPDWDNFGKVADSGNMIAWVDDCQIVDGRVRKFYSDRPRWEIEIEQLEEGIFG